MRRKPTPAKSYYDIIDDWPLIEASLAKQYGIRIRHHSDMRWDEFTTLLSGLMPDTPLGQIVSIRAETDKNVIKGFNSDQKRIHSEWKSKMAKETPITESMIQQLDALARALAGV